MKFHHDKPDTKKLPKSPRRKSRRIGAVVAGAALVTGELAGCSSSTDAQLAPVATVTVTAPGNNGDLLTKRVDVPEDRDERVRWLADRVLDGLLGFEDKAGGGTDTHDPMYPDTLFVNPPQQELATNGNPSDISFALVINDGKLPDGRYKTKINTHDLYACYKKTGTSITPSKNPDADCHHTVPAPDSMAITIVSSGSPDISSTDGLISSLKGNSEVVDVTRNSTLIPLDGGSATDVVDEVINH